MDTQLLISGVIFGLSIGSIYFLMAIGLSLCFGLMRIVSLDQLLYYSIGAYLTYSLSLATGSVWLGVLGGTVVSGVAAFAVERLIFRRIYERQLTFSMITSFGILIGGIGIIKFFWGVVPRPVPVPIEIQTSILGTDVPVYRLVVVGAAILVYLGIWIFLNRTITGKAIRAVAKEKLGAELAAENATAADIAKLRRLLHDAKEAIGDLDAFTRLSRDFHLAVAEASHNRVLVVQLISLEHVSWPRRNVTATPKLAVHVLDIHTKLADLIEMRGPIGGHFNWRAEDRGPVLLVGGGSGVVPLI